MMKKWLKRVLAFLAVLAIGPLSVVSCGNISLGQDWRTADRSSAGIAPDPERTPEAVVEVYAARAFNWRGIFAVHTWIATKPAGEKHYTVHQVMGWNKYHGLPVVVSRTDLPDRAWYGNPPLIIDHLQGERAAKAIPKILAAVESYPYDREYVLWPGPNSNTFVAHIGREVPELELVLPTTAIGKDYLTNGDLFARAPSGSGFQLSVFGLLGATAALDEGLEVNVLGLSFGVDLLRPAIKLPAVGRLGVARQPDAAPSV